MGKLLFLIDNLEYRGPARQLTILAKGLVRARHDLRVCVLGREGPLAAELPAAGVPVEALKWTRWFSLGAVHRLRRTIDAFSPDVVHAWGLPALRALAVAGNGRRFLRVVSHPFPPGPRRLALVDRWLLRRSDRVVAGGENTARRLLSLGIDAEKLATVSAAVEEPTSTAHLPPRSVGHPFLLCVGRFEEWKGHYEALWAFDMLHHRFPALHLLMVGDGPEKPRLQHFLRGLRGRRNIHFLGAVDDVPALMRQAELVWVPSRRAGGVQTALEALAAGTAVVATRVPELAEVLSPLDAEILVPPVDPPALVRRTRRLLEDAAYRRLLGENGRHLALTAHSPEQLVRRYQDVYHKRAGGLAAGPGARSTLRLPPRVLS